MQAVLGGCRTTYYHQGRGKYSEIKDGLVAAPQCIRTDDEDYYTGLYCISGVGRETALNDLRSENNVPTTKQSVHEDISQSSIPNKTRLYMSATGSGFRIPRERVMSAG